MRLCAPSLSILAGVLALSAGAKGGVTLVTFADPTIDGSTPLFQFNSGTNTLNAGWSGSNLLLQTPGLPAPDFANARFTMTPLACVPAGIGLFNTGPGSINFFDSSNVLLLTMSFSSGQLNTFSFGSSDFIGLNVVFSGPIVPVIMTDEAFGFGFANPVSVSPAGSFTATAAFTSSATALPAPGAAGLLALGGLVGLRRRRSSSAR